MRTLVPGPHRSQRAHRFLFKLSRQHIGCFLVIISAQLLGCTTAPPRQGATPVQDVTPDPLEPVNRVIFSFNDKVDRYALKPFARTYRNVTPQGIRTGVTNFLGNISDVGVAANSLLQGKLEQGVRDFARVAVNTVFGIGGILDVATPMKLERHNEDFGQTLGVWGVPEGPYLVLPFFGPQTARSTVGLLGDRQLQPLNSSRVSSSVRDKLIILNVVNTRSRLLAATSILDTASLDPYLFVRENYLKRNRQQVRDEDPSDSTRSSADNELSEFDEQDELDELAELDELDELDELNELEKLDDLDELEQRVGR